MRFSRFQVCGFYLIWGSSLGRGCFTFALLFMGCWIVGISDADFNYGALLSFCTLHDGCQSLIHSLPTTLLIHIQL